MFHYAAETLPAESPPLFISEEMAKIIDGCIAKQHNLPVRRYVRTLDLRDDPALIAEYRLRHSREKIWHEILEGIKSVGILEMEIYIHSTRLTMILEAPADLDLDAAMATLATLPRQQEWEDYMSIFQNAGKGASSADKWQPMERMFHLYD